MALTVLPVLQATKFELVINLKTAKGTRYHSAAGTLGGVDEVIE